MTSETVLEMENYGVEASTDTTKDGTGSDHQLPTPPASGSHTPQQVQLDVGLSPHCSIVSEDAPDTSRVPSSPSEGSSTLVGPDSSQQGASCDLPQLSGLNGRRNSLLSVHTLRTYWPGSFTIKVSQPISSQNVLAWLIGSFTIVTVIYTWRADKLQKWANRATWFGRCENHESSEPDCEKIEHESLGAPPFSGPSPDRGEAKRFIALAILFTLGIFSILVALSIYNWVIKRREGNERNENDSIARHDFSRSNGTQLPANHSDVAKGKGGGPRAFLPAHQAIEKLRYADESQLSLTKSRRSSNPFGAWSSTFSGSDPSLLSNTGIYYYDSEDDTAQWMKVKPMRTSQKSPSNSKEVSQASGPLQNAPVASQSESLFRTKQSGESKLDGPLGHIRRLLIPKPILVLKQPRPDLVAGDVNAALALIGAVGAAAKGGHIMEKCPVDITPEKGLPDSWMHISPQDSISN